MDKTTVPLLNNGDGKAWDGERTGAGSASAVTFLTPGLATLSAFGRVDGPTRIVVQVSADGESWFDGPSVAVPRAGDFHLAATVGARYVRLKSERDVTAVAHIQGR